MGQLIAPPVRDAYLPQYSDGQLRVIALEKAAELSSFQTPDEIVKAAEKFFDFLTKD